MRTVSETPLPQSAPEAQGIPSAAVLAFLEAAERDVHHLHSLMLLRHGTVVARGWWEPYRAESPHLLFSLSKSFTSTAVGLLVAEGRLSIDDPVLAHFPAEAPPAPSEHLRAMRVRHLLSMSTGHDADPTRAVFGQRDTAWARAFLALPVEHEPGTHFVYNTAATYMLSAIVQRIAGERMVHFLGPRLFEPLGIAQPTWQTSPQGIDVGGSGLRATTADIARFGQLYLQKGLWEGARLLPEAWVEAATARQVPNGPSPNPDWEQGYGFQFWRCRHGAYRGDGAFGQFCVVLPAQQAVVAITSGVSSLQRVLDLVWEHLLPAMGPAPLPDDRPSQAALAERLTGLRLPPPRGAPDSPLAADVSGKTYLVAQNDDGIEALRFDFGAEGCRLTVRDDGGEQGVACGYGTWSRGRMSVERGASWGAASGERGAPWEVAASGAWADERTYVAHLWFTETPFGRTLTCRFEGDRLHVEQRQNVAFGTTDRPSLEGHAGGDVTPEGGPGRAGDGRP
jgi:CubicO group peptidase (beta-lactamase class C family)